MGFKAPIIESQTEKKDNGNTHGHWDGVGVCKLWGSQEKGPSSRCKSILSTVEH